MNRSTPGLPVHRMQESSLTHATPWAPPSMGFSSQEYWSGLPFPSPGDLPDPGIKPESPALQADSLTSEPSGKLTAMYTLLYLKGITDKILLNSTEPSAECFVAAWMGEEFGENRYMYM